MILSRHTYDAVPRYVFEQCFSTHFNFTGKERDTESGLDYFGARYYASNMGRFMSPDWADKPEAVPYSTLDNPQSLNLYGYVLNNPLSRADADGHSWDDIKHRVDLPPKPARL
ncbi:RHS repeat-associated core domain-containing protein [Granulicella sp. S190]|uniref:RHS repeat-associated core domain-containing protein n=1 Tax=Granulicella sp. S190 TaxID=1747226 RepID=UPI0020B13A14|nr:RHS repeat-associated core domain-containing protein [Granulicella sp. S190]